MQFQVPDELRKYLLLDDIRGYHPERDPYVFIARSLLKLKNVDQIRGELEEFIGVRAFLVPAEQKNLVIGKFSYENFHDAGQSYFELLLAARLAKLRSPKFGLSNLLLNLTYVGKNTLADQ